MHLDSQNWVKETSKDQIIIQQKQQITNLKSANEKLQKKIDYYENFIDNMTQFEKTQNILNLKAFVGMVRSFI